ncbi:MAG: hypothetical protein QUS33_10235 [Dehalococcoidia bacterium]|nr:hypothetical protein [Dehalococcoidia bacterium]
MKRISVFTVLMLAATLLVAVIAPLGLSASGPCGDLPSTVTMSYVPNKVTAYLTTTITGDGILDGTYDGWCVDLDRQAVFEQSHNAKVVCSYDAAAEDYVAYPDNFDLVNWILNRDFRDESGSHGAYTWKDVQVAIWRLLVDSGYSGSDPTGWDADRVNDIIALAQANGEGFIPGTGDLCAVILVPMNARQEITSQVSIIALRLPGRGGEGCTPGFWKNNWKKWQGVEPGNAWTNPYDGGDRFSDVFGRIITVRSGGRSTISDPTLFQALNSTGGGIDALARHGVAALLNAASPDIDYAFSVGDVIARVQAAIDSGDYETTKDILAAQNEAGCPIDQQG